MKAVKKMSGTQSFTQLPDSQKKCLVHNIVECQANKYLSQVQSKCNCIPWVFNGNKTEQICSLDKDECIKEQSSKDDGCLVPCTGIYVDITEELFLQELRRQHSNSSRVKDEDKKQEFLSFEYIRYKRNYVKQVWFDPNEFENLSRFFFLFLCQTFPL